MLEVLHFAFEPINLPFTLLLMIVLLYWLTVIVGLLDVNLFDLDVDTHIHPHVHVDKGVQIDVDADAGFFSTILAFFNVGKVPFMIVISLLALFLWIGSMLGNHYIGQGSGLTAFLLLIPNLAVGLFLTKFLTNPLRHLFRDTPNEFESNRAMVGRTCTILLPVSDQKIGQAEVAVQRGAPVLVIVKTTDGHQLVRGEKGLIIDYDKASHTYLIEPYQ